MTENTILTSSQQQQQQKKQEHEPQQQQQQQQRQYQQQQQQQQRSQVYHNNSILISQNRSRRRLKDLNDIITCSICNGYLIEATTINDCLHAFCRSCIVQHLNREKSCPKCGVSSKQILHTNLRLDQALKALVYKLVPGLYQSECQRVIKFNADIDNNLLIASNNKIDSNVETSKATETAATTTTTTTTTNTATTEAMAEQEQKYEFDIEANYYSPDEPISLSLEYHPQSIIESGVASTPPIRYLHCPAGVTVQNLCKLIASKYDLNIASRNVKIEIIYEGEILKSHFSLMDVAYCFNWTRVSPMRFFYRIFVYPTMPANTQHQQQQQQQHQKHGQKAKESHNNALQISTTENKQSVEETTVLAPTDPKVPKQSDERRFSSKSSRKSIYEAKPQSPESGNGTSNENSLKLTLVAKKPDPKSKHDSKVKQYKPASDFKRLRSNDQKYTVDAVGNSSAISSSKHSKSEGGNKTDNVAKNLHAPSTKGSADPTAAVDLYNIDADSDLYPQPKPRINEYKVKSTTNGNGHSLADKLQKALNHHSSTAPTTVELSKNPNSLKPKYETMSKKCYVNVKKHTFASTANPTPQQQQQQANQSSEEQTAAPTTAKHRKLDIPKLKIELKNEASLKTKITVPKQEKRSPDDELKAPNFNSASSSPSSGSSSSSVVATPLVRDAFEFDSASPEKTEYTLSLGLKPVDSVDHASNNSSSHKKRKKAKHSKEPGSKRRKLHAEISSDQNDESLKLKVKITGSKPHKHERKSSSSDAQPVVPAKKEKVEEPPPKVDEEVVEEKPKIDKIIALEAECTKDQDNEKVKLQELRAVRHKPMVIIPNLNRSLSEGSNTITNMIKNIQNKAEANRSLTKKEAPLVSPPVSTFSFAAKKFPNTPAPLQIPQKVPSPHVFKTPTSLTPPPPPKVSSPNIMDSSQRLTNNSMQNRVFSPRHTPTYPTFNFGAKASQPQPPQQQQQQHQPRLSPVSAPGSGMQIYRNNVQLKRSSSVDSAPHMTTKQPHLNMMEINAQNRLIKKPVHAPTKPPISIASKPAAVQPKLPPFPFIGGVTRKLATHSPTVAKPVQTPAVCFKSTIGTASYTTQPESVVKKSLPILLPPSSISVTKMSDLHQPSPPVGPIDNRPALEIVAIPPTVPVVDQPKAPVVSSSFLTKPVGPKTTRPPPPALPLEKIKRSLTLPLTSPMAVEKPKNGTETPLDLSGKSTRSPTHETSDNGHGEESTGKEAVVKKPTTIPNLTAFKPTSYTTTAAGLPRQPLPKLNEINKVKLSTVRQQNPSVRNIPNPSALAFRNQPAKSSETPSSTPTSTKSPSPPASSTTVSSTAPSTKANVAAPIAGHTGTSNSLNNNNLNKTSLQKSNEAHQQLMAKKNLTIEQVAAGLRAKSTSANNSSGVNVV